MPAIIKPSRVSVAYQTEPVRDGALTTVSAFVLFDFAEPDRLLTEQALWPMVTDQMPNGAVFDKGQLKPKGEVIVAGAAMSPDGTPVEGLRVSVRFAGLHKQLAVFGDRSWRLTDRGIEMTRAMPFSEMPIGDVQAFGGPSFPGNRRGKGHGGRALVDAGYDAPLPNVENPAQLIKSIDDVPAPAHFGPLPADDAHRLRLLGTYDQHWIDHVSPLKPEDFNPLYHCEAPQDQRFDGFFEGGETFAISGMSRGAPSVGGQMPRLVARCFYQRTPENDLVETSMRCDTVTLFPNVQKATMTFRGLLRGQDRFAEDIGAIMFALEHRDAPRRTADYYADVFSKRTSKEDAHKYALADYQLMPEVDPAIISAKRQAKLEKAAADRQKFLDNQNWATRKMLEDEGLPGDLLPPPSTAMIDDLPLVAQPTPEEIESGDLDLAALLDDVKALEIAVLKKKDRELARAELQRRALVAATPPKLLPSHANKPLVSDELLASFDDLELEPDFQAGLDQVGAQFAGLKDQMKRDTSVLAEDQIARFDDAIGSLLDFDIEPEGPTADEIETAYQKAVARALRLPEGGLLADARKALGEVDLAALDGLDTMGARPQGAVNYEFSRMIGELEPPQAGPADFSRKALFKGTPEGIDLSGSEEAMARMEDALRNLDLPLIPKEEGADLLGELMDRVQSIKPKGYDGPPEGSPKDVALASLSDGAKRLEQAEEDITDGMLMARQQSPAPIFPLEPLPATVPSRLGAFVLEKLGERHDFKGADLAGASLRGFDFSGRDLTNTFFEQADLTDANFSGSNLTGAVFTGAILDGANFSDANLTKANFSKASLRNAVLDRAELADLTIIHADLSGAHGTGARLELVRIIESTMNNFRIRNGKLSDCQILKGSADGFEASNSRIERTVFVTIPLAGANFSGSDLERVGFMEVQAPQSNFERGNWLSVGIMGNTDLTGSRFEELHAVESSFNTAKMAECCFLRAVGNSCFFNACNMEANDFRLASFRNSLFGRTVFTDSDFFGANLFAAAMTGTDLRRCSMRAANLYAANLLEAKIASCDFSGANLGMTLLEQPTHA